MESIGDFATKTFDQNISRALANAIDPDDLATGVNRAKNILNSIGVDANRSFEAALGRNASKKLLQPLIDESQTFAGKMKASFKEAFNVKNIALGAIGGIFAADLLSRAASGLFELGKKTVSIARDAEETRSKFNVLFGEMADDTRAWANTFADSVGRSRLKTEDFLATIRAFLTPLGLGAEAADEMSKSLTSLAVDVASFNNAVDADVLRDFRSALSGEIEPVKKYGIVINEARVQQEAWRLGIAKTGQALTEQQKVQTRYRILLTDTVTAQGDAIRTADSLANQQKRLEANLTNLGETLGGLVVPALASATSTLNDFLARLGRTELEDTIATLKELGAASDLITFLSLRNNAEKAQATLQDLEREFSNLSADIKVFGATSNAAFFGQTIGQARAVKEIFSQVKDTINTAEGLVSAGKLLDDLKARAVTLEQTLLLAQQGRLTLSRQDVLVTTQQSESVQAQIAALENVLKLSTQIVAAKQAVEKSEQNIAKSNQKTSVNATAAAKVAVDAAAKQAAEQERLSKLSIEKLREELKINKENASFIQELINRKEEDVKLSEKGLAFVRKTRAELELLSASSGLERSLLAIQQEAEARRQEFAGRKDALAEVSNFEIAQIQQIIDERRKGLTELRSDLLKLTAADTFESRLAEIQREHQERIANLQAERDAVERNDKLNAAQKRELFEIISGQIAEEQQIQAGKEQKVREEIIKTNEELQKRFEIASAKTDFEAGLIALRQQFEEQIKGLKTVGKQREDDEKKINALARKEFKKSLEQFENGLDDLTKQRLKELLVKLKINLESEVNFEEFFAQLRKGLDEGLTKSGGQIFRERLAAIGKPFDDFKLFLEDYGIQLDGEFFDLIGSIDKGFANILESATKFGASLASGNIVGAISGGIALINDLFGGLGERSAEMRRIDDIQRRAAEQNAETLNRLNDSFDELRQNIEQMSLISLNQQLEETTKAIVEIDARAADLTATELERAVVLTQLTQDLQRQIAEAEARGDIDLAESLRQELIPLQAELDQIGFSISGLTAAELDRLRVLVAQNDAIREAIESFGAFDKGFAGIIERLNASFDLFDITDPSKKLKALQDDILSFYGATIPTTTEGINDFVRQGFDAFVAGGETLIAFLKANNLEELTADEFFKLLQTIEGFADDLGGVADSLSDPFQRIKDELSLLFEIADIEDPAQQLGILRTQLNRQFESLIPSDIPGLENFIQGGLRALLAGGESFGAFLEQFGLEELSREQFQELLLDFEGLMDRMNEVASEEFQDMISDLGLSFDLLNIDDPLKKLELLSKEVSKRFGAVIPQTQEAIDELLAQGTAALIAGGESLKTFLASINLEELTAEEFEELLKTLKNFADEATQQLEDATQTAEEITTSQVKSITFTQGNKLIDEVTTMRIILTQMLNGMLLPAGLNQANLAAALTGLNFGGVGASVSNNYFIIRNGTVTRVAENELDTVDRRLIENARRAAQAKGVN